MTLSWFRCDTITASMEFSLLKNFEDRVLTRLRHNLSLELEINTKCVIQKIMYMDWTFMLHVALH